MARERFCKSCREWHPVDNWPLKCMQEENKARSDHASPMLIGDTMAPVQSMLDGQMYDSKSTLRATYRQAGVTEVGNDSSVTEPKPFKRPKPDKQAIKGSVRKAFSQAGLGA